MSGGKGLPAGPGTQPEGLRPPELPPRARLDGDLAINLWKDIPALSWVMTPEDGQIHVRSTHRDAAVVTAPVSLLGRLLRSVVREQTPGPFQLLEVLPGLDGTLRHFLIIGAPVSGLNGTAYPHLAGVAIDVTHHKLRVDELAQQALSDELTGLYNLRGFLLFAEHELKVARRRQTLSAILYVDVDGLKAVNDTRGHGEGDVHLVAIARLLRSVYRECDVIARLGGDEFAVLASDVKGDPENLAKRLRAEAPAAGDSSTSLAVSIGLACCPPDGSMPLADLIAAADRSMYRDKARKAERLSGKPGVTREGPRDTST